jgi:uncharacterized LabA/DUF88 family protein
MPSEPSTKRAVAFVDGQNLYHSVREAFGYTYPNYIDVRIAIDVIRLAHHKEYDVALIFSQDQDLSEVAQEIRAIAKEQDRWIKVACAFPMSPTTHNRRGVEKTDWIQIDRATYDACLDRRDYRPKASREE